jgi:hypothetical protein
LLCCRFVLGGWLCYWFFGGTNSLVTIRVIELRFLLGRSRLCNGFFGWFKTLIALIAIVKRSLFCLSCGLCSVWLFLWNEPIAFFVVIQEIIFLWLCALHGFFTRDECIIVVTTIIKETSQLFLRRCLLTC